MKCLSCAADGTLTCITIVATPMPLADRGGTVKVGGIKVGQADSKGAWDENNDSWEWILKALRPLGLEGTALPPRNGDGVKLIRGPIFCADCEAEHFYVVGSPKPLRLGSFIEACAKGYDALTAE